MWLDWSSGVLVANAGHAHPKICRAILDQVNRGLIHNYCFPSEIRASQKGTGAVAGDPILQGQR